MCVWIDNLFISGVRSPDSRLPTPGSGLRTTDSRVLSPEPWLRPTLTFGASRLYYFPKRFCRSLSVFACESTISLSQEPGVRSQEPGLRTQGSRLATSDSKGGAGRPAGGLLVGSLRHSWRPQRRGGCLMNHTVGKQTYILPRGIVACEISGFHKQRDSCV